MLEETELDAGWSKALRQRVVWTLERREASRMVMRALPEVRFGSAGCFLPVVRFLSVRCFALVRVSAQGGRFLPE